MTRGSGPLAGLRVVELAGIGPGPHAAMILGDLGADVVRVDRPSGGLQLGSDDVPDPTLRGRRTVAADLKDPAGREAVLRLVEHADVLLEGYRPGVTERLGVGPDECHARNPRLVYGRMTGWGQDGPLATRAGHDINYISLSGALHAIGRPGERPVPPLNLVGDFGGGSMLLVDRRAVRAVGGPALRAGPGRRRRHGRRVEHPRADGVGPARARRLAATSAGRTCSTGRHRSTTPTPAPTAATSPSGRSSRSSTRSCWPVSASTRPSCREQFDRAHWDDTSKRFAEVFATRTRDEWAEMFAGTDACVTPVLAFGEVADHPHLAARDTIVTRDGVAQAAPAPRFSRTGTEVGGPPVRAGGRRDRTGRLGLTRPHRHATARHPEGWRAVVYAVLRPGRRPGGCACGSGRPGCPGRRSSRP